MIKIQKILPFLTFSLVISLALMFFSSSIVVGEPALFLEVEEKLIGISEEEREILKNLFALLQEMEETEREEEAINKEIGSMQDEIQNLEAMITKEEKAFSKKQEDLRQVLQSYQRGGPGSYLEIVLDSDNLAMFIRRINILRDLTRNTGELLGSLEESSQKLSDERRKLTDQFQGLKEKQEKLRESLAKKLQLKEEMESFLRTLEEERDYYQQHLNDIQKVWNQLKPLLAETTREFTSIIQAGNWPPDALKTSFSFFSVKGFIEEKTLNDVIGDHPGLPEIVLKLYPGRMIMALPKQNLVLSGTFLIEGDQILRFHPDEGSFYGMPLESASIEDLFKEGYPVLNLKPLIGNNIIRSIDIMEEYLVLEVKPVF